MVYPRPKMPRMVKSRGAADAFLPLKKRALMPPDADVAAGPLGSLE